jgi:recombination protein RecT
MKRLLEDRRDEFGKALAGRVDPDSFVRVAYATITKSPKLLEATAASVMMALLEAASLGLTPNSVMGEAYLVPFNNKIRVKGQPDRWEVHAQFMPGFRGLAKLARQSGDITKIIARVVREGDRFEVVQGTEEKLIHVPMTGASKARDMTRVYAIAFFKDGSPPQFEVMEKWEVDRVRQRSRSKDNGPWVTDYDEMARKTVFRRLAKYLPLSDTDFEKAIEADSRDYDLSAPIGGTGPVSDLNNALAEDIPEGEYEDVTGQPDPAPTPKAEAGAPDDKTGGRTKAAGTAPPAEAEGIRAKALSTKKAKENGWKTWGDALDADPSYVQWAVDNMTRMDDADREALRALLPDDRDPPEDEDGYPTDDGQEPPADPFGDDDQDDLPFPG